MADLTAKFILEILGRPAEHLKVSLNELIDKMGIDKGVTVLKKEIHKPKPVKDIDNLWTSFADVELKFETLPILFNSLMTYLPAHVEVFEPENVKFNTFELNEFANFVVARLHDYDALAKKMIGERDILINKLDYLKNGGKLEYVFSGKQQDIRIINKQNVVKSVVKNKRNKKGKKK